MMIIRGKIMKKSKYVLIGFIVVFIISVGSVCNAFSTQKTQFKQENMTIGESQSDFITIIEGGSELKIKIIPKDEAEFDANKLTIAFAGTSYIFLPDDFGIIAKELDDGRLLTIIRLDFTILPPIALFTVKLLYNDETLASASGRIIGNKVTFNLHPKADFSYILDKLVLSVDASASNDPDGGEIMYYLWDWGDGIISMTSEPTMTHTYAEKGSYKVGLTVVDNEGIGETITKKVSKSKAIIQHFPLFEKIFSRSIFSKLLN